MRFHGAHKLSSPDFDDDIIVDESDSIRRKNVAKTERAQVGKNVVIVNIELPALDLNVHISLDLSVAKDQQALLDEILDAMKDILNCGSRFDKVVDMESTKEKLEKLRAEGLHALEHWEKQMRDAEESRLRVENAKSQLNSMRETYHKDLQQLREQLHRKENAEAAGEEYIPDAIFNYDPTQYQFDDEVGALVKEQVTMIQTQFDQKLQNEKRHCQHQLDIQYDRLQSMAMLLERKDKLLETICQRHGFDSISSMTESLEKNEKKENDAMQRQLTHQGTRKSLSDKIGSARKSAFQRLRGKPTLIFDSDETDAASSSRRRSSVASKPFCAGGAVKQEKTTVAGKMWNLVRSSRPAILQRKSTLSSVGESQADSEDDFLFRRSFMLDAGSQCDIDGATIDAALSSWLKTQRMIHVGVQVQPASASLGIQVPLSPEVAVAPEVAVSPNSQTTHTMPAPLLLPDCCVSQAHEQHSSLDLGVEGLLKRHGVPCDSPAVNTSSHGYSPHKGEHGHSPHKGEHGRSQSKGGRSPSKGEQSNSPSKGGNSIAKSSRWHSNGSGVNSVDFQQIVHTGSNMSSESAPMSALNGKFAKPHPPKGSSTLGRAARYFGR